MGEELQMHQDFNAKTVKKINKIKIEFSQGKNSTTDFRFFLFHSPRSEVSIPFHLQQPLTRLQTL
jgi:hypothetical protein